jgi:hypothetical protein
VLARDACGQKFVSYLIIYWDNDMATCLDGQQVGVLVTDRIS